MSTPYLNKIRAFYESIPNHKIKYELTLVDRNGWYYYEESDNAPEVDTEPVKDLGEKVILAIKNNMYRGFDGAVLIEKSIVNCGIHIAKIVHSKMYHEGIKASMYDLYTNPSATEDCIVFLIHENKLTDKMTKHILKNIVKKHGAKE